MLLICVAPIAAVSVGGCALIGLSGGMIPGAIAGLLAQLHGGTREQAFAECGAVTYACAITANLSVGGAVALGLGWRAAMLFGVASGIALVGVYGRDATPPPLRRAAHVSRHLPVASAAFLVMLGFGVALEMCMLLWSPAFLGQVVGLSPSAATTASAAFPAAMLLGRWAGSFALRRMAPMLLWPLAFALLVPGFALYWGSASPPLAVLGLFLAGLAIALNYPLALGFAVGAAGPAGDTASARATFAGGVAILTAPIALGALADRVGLSAAYLIVPGFGVAIVLCFLIARVLERRGAYAADGSLP